MAKSEKGTKSDRVFTMVRLHGDATLAVACKLASIDPDDVDSVETKSGRIIGLPEDFRVITFDGFQMTISERIGGVRSVRGFEADAEAIRKAEELSKEDPNT